MLSDVGSVFTNWTVLRLDTSRRWCRCACGTEKWVFVSSLTGGLSKSCGCIKRGPSLVGKKFGVLTVTKSSKASRAHKGRVEVECKCGKIFLAQIGNLKTRHTTSCGCLFQRNRDGPEPDPIQGARWIPLGNGVFTLVDADKYDFLTAKGRLWHLSSEGYAMTDNYKGRTKKIKMHRLLVDAPPKTPVDHINANRLDNRLQNLRVCNWTESARSRGIGTNNTSGFKGLCFRKGKWDALIVVHGKQVKLGRFDNKKDAAQAYDEASEKYFKDFARPNHLLPERPGQHKRKKAPKR